MALDLPDRNRSQTLATLARAHAMTGDTNKALKLYDTIQDMRIRRTTRMLLVRELAALAEQQHTLGNRARAIATYEAVLRLRPQHATARERLLELTQ